MVDIINSINKRCQLRDINKRCKLRDTLVARLLQRFRSISTRMSQYKLLQMLVWLPSGRRTESNSTAVRLNAACCRGWLLHSELKLSNFL